MNAAHRRRDEDAVLEPPWPAKEGRLKREEVKGVSLVLRYFSFIQDLFTVL